MLQINKKCKTFIKKNKFMHKTDETLNIKSIY